MGKVFRKTSVRDVPAGAKVVTNPETIFGDGVASRSPAQQATEAGVRCRALNIMTHQGMPQSVRIAA
jgi:hypothetical protein